MAQEKPTDSESDKVPALGSDSDTEGTYSTDSDSESDDETALTPQGEGHGQLHEYPSSPTSPPIVMEGQNENGTLTGASTTSPRPMREGPEQTVSPTGVSVTAPVQPNHPIRDFRDAFMQSQDYASSDGDTSRFAGTHNLVSQRADGDSSGNGGALDKLCS